MGQGTLPREYRTTAGSGAGPEPRMARAVARREWWVRSAGAKVAIGTAALAGVALLVVLLG
ncbi:hypothetical protein [Streptomyces sp. NPDC056883]|uniref:hypothetical protein n=1 Tax=Streptomyces sp. NPDC056883 TaxID=3345959 RepID=UPI0036B12FF3